LAGRMVQNRCKTVVAGVARHWPLRSPVNARVPPTTVSDTEAAVTHRLVSVWRAVRANVPYPWSEPFALVQAHRVRFCALFGTVRSHRCRIVKLAEVVLAAMVTPVQVSARCSRHWPLRHRHARCPAHHRVRHRGGRRSPRFWYCGAAVRAKRPSIRGRNRRAWSKLTLCV